MKHAFFSLLATSAAASAFGMVDISNATVSQGFGTRDVTVSYDIISTDEPNTPVYIGFDVLTNGVSIGLENIKTLEGDIHQDSTAKAPFTAGTGYSFVWKARKDWPDHRIKDAQVKITAYTEADFQDRFDYLYVDLSAGSTATSYPVVYSLAGPDTSNGDWKTKQLWMRRIRVAPLTTFTVGIPDGNLCRQFKQETPQTAKLQNDYWIGVLELTQGQLKLINGTTPSLWESAAAINFNYDNIRGNDGWKSSKTAAAGSFLGKLAARTGLNFDLPTGAQWEYACRAGTTTDLNNGKNITTLDELCPNLDEVAMYAANCKGSFPPVAQRNPNAWGLYDMHGSVSEICLDRNRCSTATGGEWATLLNNKTEPFLEHIAATQGMSGDWMSGDASTREVKGGNWRCGPGGSFTAKPCHSGYSGTTFKINRYTTADWLGFRPAITKNNELTAE